MHLTWRTEDELGLMTGAGRGATQVAIISEMSRYELIKVALRRRNRPKLTR